MKKLAADDVLSPEELEKVPHFLVKVARRRFNVTVYVRQYAQSRSFVALKRIPCAIGSFGFETPAGTYFVMAKAENPAWTKPESSWVPKEEWGETVPGGSPENPIKAAFLKLTDDGIGIHGTDNLLSLRSKASHGCIRVRPDDATWLYKRIPTGTLVLVV